MSLAGSDKYFTVLEGEFGYLPLPFKEDQALVTCFHWIQIRAEMSERKPADAHFPTRMPNTLHSTPALLVISELFMNWESEDE